MPLPVVARSVPRKLIKIQTHLSISTSLKRLIHVGDNVKFFGAKRRNSPSNGQYATSEDFCRIFENDMDRLYLLSLLLTADPELAERCFVRGLEDSKGGNPVFREWARSWARRAIIVNAIRMIGPRPGNPRLAAEGSTHKEIPGLPEEFATVVDLPEFERFVFVISVLEGYPARDSRLLLNCSNFDIAEARSQAMQRLGSSTELPAKVASITESRDSGNAKSGLRQRLHLAASA
jgi:hypothetical protein